jgi:hypothetical protein
VLVETPETAAPRVTLTERQEGDVQRALRDLLASIGPHTAVLVSDAGEPLAVEGTATGLPFPALAEKAVAALYNIDGLAQLLQDEFLLGFCLFVGSRHDVYAFSVTDATTLLMIFDKTVVEGKLGSVWLYTKRVVEELRQALS